MKKVIFLFCILSIVIAACGWQPSSDVYPAIDHTKVGTWKTAQTIQPFLYGKFVPKDLQIEVLPFTNPGDQKAALLAGSLDVTGSTVALAIMAAAKHEPVVIVSALCNKCSALVVRQNSNITEPAQLKGKVIGYVPGTMHHVLLLEVLRKAGLDPGKDVTLKRIDFFDMGQALAQGNIDAFISGEPYPSITVKEGYGTILAYPYFDQSIGSINAVMITARDKIAANPQLIQQLVSAHVKATEQLTGHPDEWLDEAAKFGADTKVLAIARGNMELAWDVDQHYVEQTKHLAQAMKSLGLISEVPVMEELFDMRFVQQAKQAIKKDAQQ